MVYQRSDHCALLHELALGSSTCNEEVCAVQSYPSQEPVVSLSWCVGSDMACCHALEKAANPAAPQQHVCRYNFVSIPQLKKGYIEGPADWKEALPQSIASCFPFLFSICCLGMIMSNQYRDLKTGLLQKHWALSAVMLGQLKMLRF